MKLFYLVARVGISWWTRVARNFFYWATVHKIEAVLQKASILMGKLVHSEKLNNVRLRLELLFVEDTNNSWIRTKGDDSEGKGISIYWRTFVGSQGNNLDPRHSSLIFSVVNVSFLTFEKALTYSSFLIFVTSVYKYSMKYVDKVPFKERNKLTSNSWHKYNIWGTSRNKMILWR